MTRIILAISIFTAFLSSCKVLSPTVMFQTDKDFQFTEFDSVPKKTIIQPFDQLQIMMSTNNGTTLFENSSFYESGKTNGVHLGLNENSNGKDSRISYMVRQDSTVKLPVLGLVKLGGFSKDSAETILEKKLGEFYKTPFIRIRIINRNVLIFLEEGTIGHTIEIPEDGISLLDAIAELGGLSENSRAYKIKLIRGDNRNPKVYNYNISSVEEFKKANFMLEANDIIYIDSKPRYLTKFLSELQPYLVLISTAALVYGIVN